MRFESGVSVLSAEEVKAWDTTTEAQHGFNKRWTPARPYGLGGFFHRCKCAWKVFSGQADVLTWRGQ